MQVFSKYAAIASVLVAFSTPLLSAQQTEPAGTETHSCVAPAELPDSAEVPVFTPHTVRPRLLNRDALAAELAQRLAHADVALPVNPVGTYWTYVAADGEVLATTVHRSSGLLHLDRFALDVLCSARFEPGARVEHASGQLEPTDTWIVVPLRAAR